MLAAARPADCQRSHEAPVISVPVAWARPCGRPPDSRRPRVWSPRCSQSSAQEASCPSSCLAAPPACSQRGSQQPAERSQVEVEIAVGELEVLLELLHALFQRHERRAQPLDLVVAEPARLDAADGLALHELAQQLDEREHELREPALHVRAILGLDPHVPACPAKLYGGHGPVRTTSTSSHPAASSSTRERNAATRPASTRSLPAG